MLKFNFLGAGAWGLAFANHLLRCDNKIHIYTRNPFKTRELAHHLLKNNIDPKFKDSILNSLQNFPNVTDPDTFNVVATNSIGFSELINLYPDYFSSTHSLIWLTKGLDHRTGNLFSDLLVNKFNISELALISGPSFADDLVNKANIDVSLAVTSEILKDKLINCMQQPYFKLSPVEDIKAIEYAGIIKNIAAILSGMSDKIHGYSKYTDKIIGLAKADIIDFRQTYITGRKDDSSLIELINSPGCDGDLNLTCRNNISRNYQFGAMIADDEKIIDNIISDNKTVEGYDCCITLKESSPLPSGEIVNTTYRILKSNNKQKILNNFLDI